MASLEIIDGLRRSFISILTLNSRMAPVALSVKCKTASFSSENCPSLLSAASSESPNLLSGHLRGENCGIPLTTAKILLLNDSESSMSIGVQQKRGMASKAHMKYAKRKKAPVDRFGTLDPTRPMLGFERVKELELADETVKKLFSLQYASGNELQRLRKKMTEDSVRDNPEDEDDLAVKIASITEHIRAMAVHMETNKKDKVNKVSFLHSIDRRRKMLKYLRKRNYDRFLRLLDELNLTWTPPPEYYRRKTRRAREKEAVCRERFEQRQRALREFEQAWKEEKLLEIAKLKEELGKELEEEERLVLERRMEESKL